MMKQFHVIIISPRKAYSLLPLFRTKNKRQLHHYIFVFSAGCSPSRAIQSLRLFSSTANAQQASSARIKMLSNRPPHDSIRIGSNRLSSMPQEWEDRFRDDDNGDSVELAAWSGPSSLSETQVASATQNDAPPTGKHCRTCTCAHDNDMDDQQSRLNATTGLQLEADSNQGHDQYSPATSESLLSLPTISESASIPVAVDLPVPPCGLPPPVADANHIAENMSPPMPAPTYSVRRRILPESLVSLNSRLGRTYLMESMQAQTAAPYIALTEQFINQAHPSYCGITTLLMVLNTFAIDPNVRWRGGWRYFGDESVLLGQCCITLEWVQRLGTTMDEFTRLAKCNGLRVMMKRPHCTVNSINTTEQENALNSLDYQPWSESKFRSDILQWLEDKSDQVQGTTQGEQSQLPNLKGVVVVSFSRRVLGQTGDGHYSPLAAYHHASDSVLLLDVARFKYQPYWVRIADLYKAFTPIDKSTGLSRGWYILQPPVVSITPKIPSLSNPSAPFTATKGPTSTSSIISSSNTMLIASSTDGSNYDRYEDPIALSEGRRPIHLVPEAGGPSLCPAQTLKVEYCPIRQASKSRTS